ncbi:MAG: Re/Si-specific NAD(P)(+) transhydrogenase subunit alpha [Saprospiraceae bacterium]|nr:Re/Si-specific NAD(P)(+) transhydrogenase subunit alpha [Saprospiraceae bacterium]MDZ4704026.1 Re/Si-specific NAD(P)(+) transhydrogenase subunit alpha [Saprospiraceae bacterium]
MQIGILKEKQENRVAIAPDALAKIKALGVEVCVEASAGVGAMYDDDAYAAEARVVSRETLLEQSDLIISINPPDDAELSKLKEGAVLIAQFQPFLYPEVIPKLQSAKLVGISLDMIPRTTLAQTMDVLSSMASIAGYKAVLEAARLLPRYFPMFITAAGSVRPAKVLVIGAGVAGLQAIATARRLGAAVEAFDTRSAAKEEVLSLGAKFVEVEGARDDSAAGGYAVQQSEDFLQRQRAEVQSRASKSDVIITTAQVRGGKAPMLIAKETVEQMRKGSVIIDLAASSGGNCELTRNNETVIHNGVQIVGNSNLAALMPQDASFLYSNNVLNLLKILIKDGAVNLNLDNEIIRGSCITK